MNGKDCWAILVTMVGQSTEMVLIVKVDVLMAVVPSASTTAVCIISCIFTTQESVALGSWLGADYQARYENDSWQAFCFLLKTEDCFSIHFFKVLS